MMLETVLTILQSLVLPALVPLAHRALQVYLWRRRAEDVREYNVMLAAAPSEEARRVIESNPPPPPPDFGAVKTILILLLSGAALLGALGKAPLIVAGSRPPAPSSISLGELGAALRPMLAEDLDPQELAADASGGSCSTSKDCGSGCTCHSGACQCTARRPRPQPAPRKLASLQGQLCADCLALPWSPEPIETLWVRRRED